MVSASQPDEGGMGAGTVLASNSVDRRLSCKTEPLEDTPF